MNINKRMYFMILSASIILGGSELKDHIEDPDLRLPEVLFDRTPTPSDDDEQGQYLNPQQAYSLQRRPAPMLPLQTLTHGSASSSSQQISEPKKRIWMKIGSMKIGGKMCLVKEELNPNKRFSRVNFFNNNPANNGHNDSEKKKSTHCNLRNDNLGCLVDLFSLVINPGPSQGGPEKVSRQDFCKIVLRLISLAPKGSPVYFRSLLEIVLGSTMASIIQECFSDTFGSHIKIRTDDKKNMLTIKCRNPGETSYRLKFFLGHMHLKFMTNPGLFGNAEYPINPSGAKMLEKYPDYTKEDPVELTEGVDSDAEGYQASGPQQAYSFQRMPAPMLPLGALTGHALACQQSPGFQLHPMHYGFGPTHVLWLPLQSFSHLNHEERTIASLDQ